MLQLEYTSKVLWALCCILTLRDAISVSASASLTSSGPSFLKDASSSTKSSPLVLIIDVDNCLYSEKELSSQNSAQLGIEEQIILNTHAFGKKYFNLSKQECDELYKLHGSTIEGIRHMLLQKQGKGIRSGNDDLREVMEKFYREVYDSIDMTPLSITAKSSSFKTGYNHAENKRKFLVDLLQSIPYPVYLASNSPKAHVKKVLSVLGLRGWNYEGILTPDSKEYYYDDNDKDVSDFPTKSQPEVFYQPILDRYTQTGQSSPSIVLLDDSLTNLKQAAKVGINGLQVNNSEGKSPQEHVNTLEEAIGICLGHIRPNRNSKAFFHPIHTSFTRKQDEENKNDDEQIFDFSDVKYLQNKNKVDMASINKDVWNTLARELVRNVAKNTKDPSTTSTLHIVDVGAGLLSMLEMILKGGGGKESLVNNLNLELSSEQQYQYESNDKKNGKDLASTSTIGAIHYIAYEPNQNLLDGCREKLKSLGFNPEDSFESIGEYTFIRNADKDSNMTVRVSLRMKDFTDETETLSPHLIVGCCFADLFEPHDLVSSLMNLIGLYSRNISDDDVPNKNHSTLVYFPITFTGTTQFFPPKPVELVQVNNAANEKKSIRPSDTTAFQLYADNLVNLHGHNLDPSKIIRALEDSGAQLLEQGRSNWNIDYKSHKYLWKTMLYFFGNSAAPEIMKNQWDSVGWIERSWKDKSSIIVQNIDLLFSLPLISSDEDASKTESEKNIESDSCDVEGGDILKEEKKIKSVEEISFTAPYKVGTAKKEWNTHNGSHLKPGQIEVQSVCSLISSGTELKIFKGMFEEAALDVNIKDMADEVMKYPLSYGYSMVGIVTRCASDVADADEIIGRLVFTFSPHSTDVIVDRDSAHLIPDGISAEDAIFMPAVETALSIVHDAHVRVGEVVSVFGQGLIGLLVNAILSKQQIKYKDAQFGTVTVIDTLSDRLAMASKMGASQAIMPDTVSYAGPFDVSIEVSGNYRALQSAIDSTRSGGRIIVGSWYGNADVKLKLGIDFHRSHKTIKTSQVSIIPAELSALWSKERRFNLTWELVRSLKPSRLITKKLTLQDAQIAYELLDKGKEIAICFVYK